MLVYNSYRSGIQAAPLVPFCGGGAPLARETILFLYRQAFSDELITEGRREHFAQRAVRWLRGHHLDGLQMHWMFPGQGNGRPSDRQNLPRLLHQLKQAFKASGHLDIFQTVQQKTKWRDPFQRHVGVKRWHRLLAAAAKKKKKEHVGVR